ncbi:MULTISPECIES: hypothetical protein [Alteribacter]|uniref:STAS/SEC14 domain-containing protein n=1 Tax=Alteribacter keqinensis TaxID=2483800 RepID=A0A3M7TT53_9BACI|nr:MULTISPECIES: hypothetical protein [Alteribacter]MBM7095461.1 hypothetical protein [Alteribacter salitolerans]RNA67932.1 hypothetical protein EBO34_14650 [Alteribacter keqinensis]
MWDVKIVDTKNHIIYLKWAGLVKPREVGEANNKLAECIDQLGSRFDMVVDMAELKVWTPETQQEIVKHQQWLIGAGLGKAAVVVNGAIAKMQLKRTAKESSHSNEHHFTSYEDAMAFLQKEAVV